MKIRALICLCAFFLAASCSRIHIYKDVDPLSTDERFKLASIYEANGEDAAALDEYMKALATDRKNAPAHFAAGNICLKMKKFEDAEAHYQKAIALDPLSGPYRNNLSWAYMEMGELQKAEAEAKEALRLDQARQYIYLDTLGEAQSRGGRYREAEDSFLKALGSAPEGLKEGRTEIYRHLSGLYKKTGETEKAKEVEERLRIIRMEGGF